MRIKFERAACAFMFFAVQIMWVGFVNVCHGGESDVTQPMVLFELPAGGSAPGMGGAFLAVSDDSSAVLYNPAGLAQLKKPSVTVMQSKQSLGVGDDSKYNFLNVVYPLSARSTIALTYLENGVGGLPNYQVTDYDCDQPGSPHVVNGDVWCDPAFDTNPGKDTIPCGDNDNDGRDDCNPDPDDDWVEGPERFGSFDQKESAVVLSYAQQVGEGLSLGASLKLYDRKIGPFVDVDPASPDRTIPGFVSFSNKAKATSLDVGALYKFLKTPKGIDAIHLGIVLQDVNSPSVRENSGSTDSQKLNFRAGIAIKLLEERLTLAVDYNKRTFKEFLYGAEYWVNKMLGLRLGNDDGDFTAGVSLSINSSEKTNFRVDYAYKKDDTELFNANRIAVTVGF